MMMTADPDSARPSTTLSRMDLGRAQALVEERVRASGSSFFWAMRTLGEQKRLGMYAVYAFCRDVDDIADEPGAIDDKKRMLADWRVELDRIYRGEAEMPIGIALEPVVHAFDLQPADFMAVIDGMETDARPVLRIADEAALDLYVDRVACAVGRLSNRVFGIMPEAGEPIAKALGEALQLTNILRDVAEDADRNRLYLPLDALNARGIAVPDDMAGLKASLRGPELVGILEGLAERAHARFHDAQQLLARTDQQLMRPAIVMMEVYRRIFDQMQRRGWKDWQRPVSLSKVEKMWIGLRYGLLG